MCFISLKMHFLQSLYYFKKLHNKDPKILGFHTFGLKYCLQLCKLFKTTSPPNLFPSDSITLYDLIYNSQTTNTCRTFCPRGVIKDVVGGGAYCVYLPSSQILYTYSEVRITKRFLDVCLLPPLDKILGPPLLHIAFRWWYFQTLNSFCECRGPLGKPQKIGYFLSGRANKRGEGG